MRWMGLKLLESIYQMANQYRFGKDMRQGMTNLFAAHLHYDSYEEQAKENLIAIDQADVDRERFDQNGTEITRWNNYQLNILSKERPKKRRKVRVKPLEQRKTFNENCFTDDIHPHFSTGNGLKKQSNKLYLPLKEKMLNSQQFNSVDGEPERAKTRNEVKLDIINSKFQIGPLLPSRKKMPTQCNCQHIVKLKTETSHYQRIRRRGFCTVEIQMGRENEEQMLKQLSKTREKSFFLSQTPQRIKLRGNSIHQLFSK